MNPGIAEILERLETPGVRLRVTDDDARLQNADGTDMEFSSFGHTYFPNVLPKLRSLLDAKQIVQDNTINDEQALHFKLSARR